MDADVEVVWDHLQINKILATYCRAIDRCDKELLRTVYWPDALEDHGIFNGNALEFAEFIVPLLSGMKSTMHQISNVLIELHGTHAAVETYVVAYHAVPAADGSMADLVVGGRYLDKFERRGGAWRIAHRTFVMDWNQNQPSTAIWESGLFEQLKVRGSHDRSDPSYRLFGNRSPS
ncbi:MAG: nuclear transport factor 2 family protein [Gammaproteobacteria bacterium]